MSVEDWWKEDKPIFPHNCDSCRYLGQHHMLKNLSYDLYICVPNNGSEPSLLARFGDDGPEYWSADLSSCLLVAWDGRHDFIRTAMRRATQEGLITPEKALEALKMAA